MNKFLYPIAGAVLLVACKTVNDANEEKQIEDKKNQSITIDLDYMNKDVRAQDDFFEFSNGTWVKNNPVPASESRWGSFNELRQSNMDKLTNILEEAKNGEHEIGSMNQILGDFYTSYTDIARRNTLGFTPIENEIGRINRINSKKDIVAIISSQHKRGISSLFRFGVGQDLKDVNKHIVSFSQGGLGLPNKTYYTNSDKEDILSAYRVYVETVISSINKKDPDKFAANVVEFELMLAEAMLEPAEMREPTNRYNKMSRKDAERYFGNFDLEEYLSLSGITSFDSLNVGQPLYIKTMGSMLGDVHLDMWKDYLLWKSVNHYCAHLDESFIKMHFDFYSRTLSGTSEMKPLNERAIDELTSISIGELLGKAFVEKHFSQEAQTRVDEMVDNLLIVFRERIENLEWMSKETKNEALNKLNSIGRKLGFPSKWNKFDKLGVSKHDYVQNLDEIAYFDYLKNINKLGKPVDKEAWEMPAHMVNAYYHPLLNEIAFPAGIMQAPFFDSKYEDAVNYGRIGMVIGHEFTHGFDDMGSKFAADGSFKNWWTESDRTLFEQRTEKLGNTFSGFCPIDGHCVNPNLTMGENIADLGGLTMAYHAYARTNEFKEGKLRKGYTPAQRFFISYAQLWKINFTDAELKKRIATDPHSPGMYRVNGPLMNCPEFFEAFDVKVEDPMRNTEEKIARIW